MVLEIENSGQFNREIAGPGLVVVDFFTTWCGPCKQIAPFIDQLSRKYPEVKFIKVDIERNEDIARPLNISSIPTFHFYVNGQLKDEMKGANSGMLEAKIMAHKVDVNPFGGQGNKLSSVPSENGPTNARDARLRALGHLEGPHIRPTPKEQPKAEDDEDEALAKALALSIADSSHNSNTNSKSNNNVNAKVSAEDEAEIAAMEAEQEALDQQALNMKAIAAAGANNNNGEWDEEMVPVPVNEQLLTELMDMGFPDVRARKSIVHGINLDGALAWLDEHQDDADIDQPYMVRKSDTIPKAPLTAEEKAARLQAMKDKVKQRREDKAKEAKAEEIRREKERRERGQKIDETLEERQRLQRKREAEKMKREKDEQNKERARLRAEIARDKEIRKLNKGVLPSVLGVEGYNPSAPQYDVKDDSLPPVAPTEDGTAAPVATASIPAKRPVSSVASSPSPTPAASKPAASVAPKKTASPAPSASSGAELDPAARVDQAIQTLMRYRTGGDGGAALKLLLTFVKNIVEHPEDPKYRSINTESAAFKSKLTPLVGPVTLLKAVGFEKNEEDGKLKFEGEVTATSLISLTALKLTQAEALYRQQNP